MSQSYNGKLLLDQALLNKDSLTYFAHNTIEIKKEDWAKNIDGGYFFYSFPYIKNFIPIHTTNVLNKDVLVEFQRTEDGKNIKVSAISDDSLKIEYIHKVDYTSKNSSAEFNPITKSSLVLFNDGETLEMKYQSGNLGHGGNRKKSKYTKHVHKGSFISNGTEYKIMIHGEEHNLGGYVSVSKVIKKLGNFTYEQLENADYKVEIITPEFAYSNSTICVTTKEPFEGYIICEQENYGGGD